MRLLIRRVVRIMAERDIQVVSDCTPLSIRQTGLARAMGH